METFPQIIAVINRQKGLIVAKNILYKKVNDQTVLFLSGGSTPKDLYETLAKERKLKPNIVGMVDERADRSNYKMIKSTGLLDYFENSKIRFYPMISSSSYDKSLRRFINSSANRVAIMGIGSDGHTASLPAGIKNSKFRIQNYTTKISNFPGEFRERITLTFKALSKMNELIILAFGENKKAALKKMFEKGSQSEIPARFYTRPEIAKKTILITDQKI